MYVPVLKNRTVEMNVLSQLGQIGVFDTDSVIPLVELIQEKTRSNNHKTYLEELAEFLFYNKDASIMLDLYKSTKLNKTTDAIRNYVSLSTRSEIFCVQEIQKLEYYSDRVIPVVSYLNENFSKERIMFETNEYRRLFSRIAFRLKTKGFEEVFPIVETIVEKNDFIILDIETASYMNPVFKKIYKTVSDSKKKKGFISCIINANRPETLTNKAMSDGAPISEIDNGLKELYNTSYMHKFDAFGDYACVVASLPSSGGTISPAGVYYSNDNNYFVAFKGRLPSLSEFQDYIAPSIIKSEYWSEYTELHHEECPGCNEILLVASGKNNGRNQAQWKMITMLHYIYALFESNA